VFARKYANEEIPMTSKLFMYFKERGNSEKLAMVYILSDCTVAIDIVTRSSKHYSRPDLIRRIKTYEDSLLKMNISVVVA